MYTMRVILLLCVLTTTACNLRYRGDIAPGAAGTQEIEVAYEAEAAASSVETVSAARAASYGRPARACTPRLDWPQYRVVAGDTLSEIALRVHSSVSELAAANCLSNTRLIQVNQRLFVPLQPQ